MVGGPGRPVRFCDVFVALSTALRLRGAGPMSLYRHPHLTRGVMHTPQGAFRINRGIVDLPDALGESLGWASVLSDEDVEPGSAAVPVSAPRDDRGAVRAARTP